MLDLKNKKRSSREKSGNIAPPSADTDDTCGGIAGNEKVCNAGDVWNSIFCLTPKLNVPKAKSSDFNQNVMSGRKDSEHLVLTVNNSALITSATWRSSLLVFSRMKRNLNTTIISSTISITMRRRIPTATEAWTWRSWRTCWARKQSADSRRLVKTRSNDCSWSINHNLPTNSGKWSQPDNR